MGKVERFGIAIVFALILIPPMLGQDIAQTVIGAPAYWLLEHIMMVTGNGSINPSS